MTFLYVDSSAWVKRYYRERGSERIYELLSGKDVAARLALRGADAVHFAAPRSLERHVSSSGHQVVLVTSDRELKEAATASGIHLLDPDAEPAG